MTTIIKNGIIVNSSDIYKADIKIENEKIAGISEYFKPEEKDHVIDAKGQYILPGGIDVHTHLSLPGSVDDFNSGTMAAASGGITSIINYTNPVKGQSVIENFREWKEKASSSIIDYGFHSIINECNEQVLQELPILSEEEGVTSIKLFMANQDGDVVIDDVEMYKIMKTAGESGIITNVHAENGNLINQLIEEMIEQEKTTPIYHAYTRPSILEAEATNRAIRIGELSNAPVYIVHVSSADSLYEIVNAKKRGVQVYAETCPQYLTLDISYLEKPEYEGVKYICSPPLREKYHQNELWQGINDNQISTIGSDHSSIPFKGGKYLERNNFSNVSNGCPGIENSLSLIYHFGVHEQLITLQKFVEIMSTNPAKIFGLYPRKGGILVGSDADIVIFDPNKTKIISEKTQFQSTDYNLYEGMKVQGTITNVLSRGELIFKDDKVLGISGRGKFLYRKKFNENPIN